MLVDNSALSLLSCKRRFQLTVLQGLKTKEDKALAFGSAFHTCVEHLDKGKDISDAMALATKDRDINELLLLKTITLFKASTRLPAPLELEDGKPAIEVKFAFPYKSVITAAGKAVDVHLSGTIDRIHIDPDTDTLVILDYKTAADVSDSQIRSKMDSYTMSFQLPFYVFCLMHGGLLPEKYHHYFKENRYRVEIMFAFYNAPVPQFKRLIKQAFNHDFILREVPLIINQRILEIVNIASMGESPAPHDGMNVYKACDYCPYRPACLMMGTERELEYLSRFYREEYNPLTFR